MTLRVFNPEHDIALASGLSNFTAPHAGRRLRHDLGYLPAVCAREGDIVLVDDVSVAMKSWRQLRHRLETQLNLRSLACPESLFRSLREAAPAKHIDCIDVWGWDSALTSMLKRRGYPAHLMPDDHDLAAIRQLSHRRTASHILAQLTGLSPQLVGSSSECSSVEEVELFCRDHCQVVLKSPWSSSGRGLRFVGGQHSVDISQHYGWIRNVILQQGSLMAEPYYNKVKDFGMEFTVTPSGQARYDGLSLFSTSNGQYVGNIVATEQRKRDIISRYIPTSLLDCVSHQLSVLLTATFGGNYSGPLGVDMMVVTSSSADGFLLHPCVEINVRRTMGHVALAISPESDDVERVMRIEYANNNYQMKILRL